MCLRGCSVVAPQLVRTLSFSGEIPLSALPLSINIINWRASLLVAGGLRCGKPRFILSYIYGASIFFNSFFSLAFILLHYFSLAQRTGPAECHDKYNAQYLSLSLSLAQLKGSNRSLWRSREKLRGAFMRFFMLSLGALSGYGQTDRQTDGYTCIYIYTRGKKYN